MSFNITVEGGKSVRLKTKGKYCDRDIVVTAEGGEPTIEPLEITENGTYTAPDGVAGYSPVTVNVAGSGGEDDVGALLENTLTEINSNATKVVVYACRGLSELKTVNLPKATVISTYAFYGCTAMTDFNAPQVATLGTYAFYQCSKMTQYLFPLATGITASCFYGNGALTQADFGAAKSIAASAFYNCYKLKALILRYDGVVSLANVNAFTNCHWLKGTVNATYNPGGQQGYVYVPRSRVSSYTAATNWVNAGVQFRILEDYTVDGTITGEMDKAKMLVPGGGSGGGGGSDDGLEIM